MNAVLQGSAWQRCRVHFMRNVLTKVPKADADMVATWIRTIFTRAPPARSVPSSTTSPTPSQASHPRVAEMLREAKADLTAFADFPQAHWRKIWSTNPLERLNKEIKRRTDVVGIFPNTDALLRLSACVLIEAHDEWQDTDRRYLSETSMALLYPADPTTLRHHRHHRRGGIRTRYCMIDPTHAVTRDELHHPTGRDQKPLCAQRILTGIAASPTTSGGLIDGAWNDGPHTVAGVTARQIGVHGTATRTREVVRQVKLVGLDGVPHGRASLPSRSCSPHQHHEPQRSISTLPTWDFSVVAYACNSAVTEARSALPFGCPMLHAWTRQRPTPLWESPRRPAHDCAARSREPVFRSRNAIPKCSKLFYWYLDRGQPDVAFRLASALALVLDLHQENRRRLT